MNTTSVQQSSAAMANILMMAVTKGTAMAEKMIPLSLATGGSSDPVSSHLGSLLDITA